MNSLLAENIQIVSGFVPVDLQAGNNVGDWVSLKYYSRCAIVFFAAAGTAGDDPTITLEQAKDYAGTDGKALNFKRLDVKQGAALTAIGQYTKVTQDAANTYSDGDAAEEQKIWVIEVMDTDLDVNDGFTCIRASIGDVGNNAQHGCMLYMMTGPRYQGDLPSAIDDPAS